MEWPSQGSIKLDASAFDPQRGTKSEGWDWKVDWHGKEAPPAPQAGDEWEMRGFETGGFGGVPEEVDESLNKAAHVATAPFRFSVQFKFIAMRVIR